MPALHRGLAALCGAARLPPATLHVAPSPPLCTPPQQTLSAGQREPERRAAAGFRFDTDVPAVALDDLLAQRQPDAGAGILGAPVQALEQREDALEVFRRDADAVVRHGEAPAFGAGLRTE